MLLIQVVLALSFGALIREKLKGVVRTKYNLNVPNRDKSPIRAIQRLSLQSLQSKLIGQVIFVQ